MKNNSTGGWKITAIVLIVLFVLIVAIMIIGLITQQKDNKNVAKCAAVCLEKNPDSVYLFEFSTNICSCSTYENMTTIYKEQIK